MKDFLKFSILIKAYICASYRHFLLVNREIPSFDVQHTTTRKTKHILKKKQEEKIIVNEQCPEVLGITLDWNFPVRTFDLTRIRQKYTNNEDCLLPLSNTMVMFAEVRIGLLQSYYRVIDNCIKNWITCFLVLTSLWVFQATLFPFGS